MATAIVVYYIGTGGARAETGTSRSGYVLTMKNGTQYHMDKEGRTTSITDRWGINTISIEYETDSPDRNR